MLAGQVKRRGALVGAGVDVGSVADQQGGQRRVAVQGGDVERREAVDVAAVDAESSGLKDRQLQRGQTVRRRLTDQTLIIIIVVVVVVDR